MPTARIDNATPRARATNGAPVGYIRRGRSLISTMNTIPVGSPIGLLLALTYAEEINYTTYSEGGEAPHASIK